MSAELRMPTEAAPEVVVEEHGIRVIKENGKNFLAKAWRGKAKKPYAYYQFRTEEARDAWVAEEVSKAAATAVAKAERAAAAKVKKAEFRTKYTVGTVLCNSWGYDQTNIDFYEVVRRSATGATVWVRPIELESVPGSGGFMCDTVVPDPGKFCGDEIKKVVGAHGVQFSFGWTVIVNPESKHYRSWYA